MRRIFYPLILITLACILTIPLFTGCSKGNKTGSSSTEVKTITVSAASSLQDALTEIKDSFEKDHPDIKVNFNFGASGSLQKQIEEGAPVDIFISAGKKQMDELAAKSLISVGSRKNLLTNELVLIVNESSTGKIKDFQSLKNGTFKLSIGTPETVPAGKYAKETLEKLDLWSVIQNNLVYAKDVRQVVTYVETGNVDAGIVYYSDTIKLNNSKLVTYAPKDSHKPIVYPVAIVKGSQQVNSAQTFLDFLKSSKSTEIFKKYLFSPAK